jgi:S-adenosylmethionine hydrolase
MHAVRLPVSARAAPTFHGRDVFAPAAARLAVGATLDALGDAAPEPVVRRTPEPRRLADGTIEGTVIAIDRFGNAITNLLTHGGGEVLVNGQALPLRRVYVDGASGESIALVGSNGLIEIAVREGRADRVLGLARGATVRLRPLGRPGAR